jgi:hypothetical protein
MTGAGHGAVRIGCAPGSAAAEAGRCARARGSGDGALSARER